MRKLKKIAGKTCRCKDSVSTWETWGNWQCVQTRSLHRGRNHSMWNATHTNRSHVTKVLNFILRFLCLCVSLAIIDQSNKATITAEKNPSVSRRYFSCSAVLTWHNTNKLQVEQDINSSQDSELGSAYSGWRLDLEVCAITRPCLLTPDMVK